MLEKLMAVGFILALCEDCPDDTCVLQTHKASMKSGYDPPQGLGPGGNPVPLIEDTSNLNVDDEVLACADPKWHYDAQNMWTFEQIGEAFMEFGYKKFYKPGSVDALSACVGSLTIAAGECQETLQSMGIGCDAKATKHMGVFQLDYLLSMDTPVRERFLPQIEKDGGIMNLCISGFGAGYITGAPFTNNKKTNVAELEHTPLYTCMEAPADVNDYSCPDPEAKPGVTYPNFIGTFCHKGYLQRWSPCNIKSTEARCCGLFNGGANSGILDQPPFPEYYFKKADEHLKKMPKGKNFKTICEKIIAKMEAPSLEQVNTSRKTCHTQVISGDTCYLLQQTWDVDGSKIKNTRTGKTCAVSPDLWEHDNLDIMNPPLPRCFGLSCVGNPLGSETQCEDGPAPPVPSPEYVGQFVMAIDKWRVWDYKAGLGQIGICFGGASIIEDNKECDKDGRVWQKMMKMTQEEGDKYYDFGGGEAQSNQWITPELVAALDGHMDKLKEAGYKGIFYDIETFKNDFVVDEVLTALQTSFSKAKSKGLKVMASTSYTSPYLPRAYPADYQQRADQLWKGILANEDIDFFLPQFYGNGVTADIVKTYGSSIDFNDWTNTIKATSETNFQNQVQQMKDKCSNIGQVWCESGFLLWGSEK